MKGMSKDERAKIIKLAGESLVAADSSELIKLLSRTSSEKSREEVLKQLEYASLDRRKIIALLHGLSAHHRKEMHALLCEYSSSRPYFTQLATDFCDDIASILWWDVGALVALPHYARNGSEQRQILDDILSCSDALLSKLLPLRSEGVGMNCTDRSTATLIQIALAKSNQEKWMLHSKNDSLKNDEKYNVALLQTTIADLCQVINEGAQSPETVSNDHYESVSFNYPNALIDSLTEFRNAVNDAKKEVIKKDNKQENPRSNSSIRDSKIIRKNSLANAFVTKYKERYGELPPISRKGPVEVFQLLLVEAGFNKAAHFTAYSKAIRRAEKEGLQAKKNEDLISRINARITSRSPSIQ